MRDDHPEGRQHGARSFQPADPPVHPETVDYHGYLVSVDADTNEFGAWLPRVAVTHRSRPVALPEIEPVQPEWLTRAEALRAGIEYAKLLIDRHEVWEEVPKGR
jgi:hypothetical protein